VGDRVLLVKGIPIEATAIIAHEKADDLRRRGYDAAFIERAQGLSCVIPASAWWVRRAGGGSARRRPRHARSH
jgi:hydrogenase maturation factor